MSISLRDFFAKQGWTSEDSLGYTPASGTDERGGPINPAYVSMKGPTGNSFTFQQGQGGQYGVGDFRNGSHYVTNPDQLMRLMTMDAPKTDPASGKAPYEYQNKYLTDENVQNRFANIDKPFEFNESNPQWQFMIQAQNQAKDAVMKHYAQHGLAVGSKMQQRMQNEAQNLVPQYENIAYGRHMDERQNQYNMLAEKHKLEGLNYKQYQDLQRYEVEQHGTMLSPEMRQHISVYQSMDEQSRRDLDNLFGEDYHAEINRRRNINPNDPLIPVLEAARANKVLSDPELFAKYGSQYGFSSSAIAERGQHFATQQKQYEALVQNIEKGEIEKAILSENFKSLPERNRLELLQMAANIEATKKQTALMGSTGGSGGTGTYAPEQQKAFQEDFKQAFSQISPYALLEALLGPDKESYKNALGTKFYYEALNKANKMANEWDKMQAW